MTECDGFGYVEEFATCLAGMVPQHECGDRRCTEPIDITRAEYEEIRTEPLRFLIALNHENPDSDTVLLENPRFATVEKVYGEPSKIARATDPRRGARC